MNMMTLTFNNIKFWKYSSY